MNTTDPSFKYTNAASTDIRKLFDRVRREQKAREQKALATQPVPITKARKSA